MNPPKTLLDVVEVMNLARHEIILAVGKEPATAPLEWMGEALERRVLLAGASAALAREAVERYLRLMARTDWRIVVELFE
jgi:hypothetical protein